MRSYQNIFTVYDSVRFLYVDFTSLKINFVSILKYSTHSRFNEGAYVATLQKKK